MKSGIYQIRNTVDRKVYIGQSKNVELRYKQHFGDLGRGVHGNQHLQNAFWKYGKDSFEFSVLELCPIELLDEREIYWISQLDAVKNGYNMTMGGGGTRGIVPSEETRKKQSELSKQRWENPAFRERMIKSIQKAAETERVSVIQIETGRIFTSVTEAGQSVGHGSSDISAACTGKCHVCGDYHWRYYTPEIEAILNSSGFDLWRASILSTGKTSPVVCIETGEMFSSIRDAENKTNIHYSSISKCCLYKAKSAHGFHWRYANTSPDEWSRKFKEVFLHPDPKAIRVVCVDTGLLFASINEAAQFAGVSKTAISYACQGLHHTAGKYHWKYESTTDKEYYEMQESLKNKQQDWKNRLVTILKSEERKHIISTATKKRWSDEKEREMMKNALKVAIEKRKKRVLQIETGVVFESITEAATAVGLKQSSGIVSCCTGKREKAGGYHWRYAD